MKNILSLIFLALASLVSIKGNGQCSAGFSYTVSGDTVSITNTSQNYDVYYWDFGDGNFSDSVQDPVHVYPGPGIYQICLSVGDTTTFCFDDLCDTLYLGGATCGANFNWGANGTEAQFFAFSLGTYDSLSWDFGDGTTDTGSFVTHIYPGPGNYTACLVLYDSGQVCDSSCQTITIANNNCIASYSYSSDGLTVDFTNNSSGDYDEVYWDLGDGFGWSDQMDPTYTYTLPGTYFVCLQVYNVAFTCFDDYCMEITVTTGGGETCEADFTYTTNELEVQFTNQSTGSFMFTAWTFGTDGFALDANPAYTFSSPGTYDVCLTITDLFGGCFDMYCEPVTVNEFTCGASFSYAQSWGTQNISFENTSTGTYDSTLWEFGDGNTSSFNNPMYSYNVPGNYEVCVNLYDEGSLCGTGCAEISVWALGIDEEQGKDDFLVHPNPASDFAIVRFNKPASGPAFITITDVSGRVVSHYAIPKGTTEEKLDLKGISGGYYTISVLRNGIKGHAEPFIVK